MFSNTLGLLSSRNVNDQVSHPYKTTGKIIVNHAHIGQNAAFSELGGTSQKLLTECGNFTMADGIVSSDGVRIISGQK